jgi:NADPH:quinone reductase-like Zn-dependent oxidoreductase
MTQTRIATMPAVVQHRYGGPEVLSHAAVPAPVPGKDEVLVEVRAVGLNAADWHLMRGEPALVRLATGLRRPRQPILGSDVAGVVAAVGAAVTGVQPGQRVMAEVDRGGLAGLVAVPERFVALAPEPLTDAEAAALPMASLTALQAVRDAGQVRAAQRVLVHGASGGVGTYAVQIAKAFDAHVTAVCRTRNVEQAAQLGADVVLDATAVDVTARGEQYDVVIDVTANRRLADMRRLVTPTGRYVLVGAPRTGWLGIGPQLAVAARGMVTRQALVALVSNRRRETLDAVRALVEAGTVRPVIERVYPWEDAVAAVTHVDSGHARGKIVVTGPGSADQSTG